MMHQVTFDELSNSSFVSQKHTRQFQRKVKQFFSSKALKGLFHAQVKPCR